MSLDTAVGEPSREVPLPPDDTEPVRAQGPGLHRLSAGPRTPKRPRQRPIRATLTVLLVIPLVSLVALWAYAASSTVGGAIAQRNSDTSNRLIGAPTAVLFEDLALERADTFIWQSGRGLEPKTSLVTQRKQTDAASAGPGSSRSSSPPCCSWASASASPAS